MSFLIFLSIIILVSSFHYLKLFQVIDDKNEELYNTVFINSSDIINNYLAEFSSISKQITSNPDVTSFLTQDICNPDSPHYDPVKIMRIQDTLYVDSNLLENICLYSKTSNKIIDMSTVFTPNEYDNNIHLYNGENTQDFINNIKGPNYNRLLPHASIEYNGEKKSVILWVTSFPLFQSKDSINGYIILMINNDKFHQAIQKYYNDEENYIYFFHHETCISKSDSAPTFSELPKKGKSIQIIDGVKYLIYSTGQSNGYTWSIATPYANATKELTELRFFIFSSIFLFILIFIFIAIYMSWMNAKPIRAIADSLTAHPIKKDDNEYTIISDSINHLRNTELYLQNEIEQNLPIMVSNFVQSLILGNLTNEAEILALSKKLKLDITEKHYIVLLISLLDISSTELSNIKIINSSKLFLKPFLSKYINVVSTETSATDLVFIVSFPEINDDNDTLLIENAVNEAGKELNRKFGIRLKATLSDPCTSLCDIFFAYQSALDKNNNGIQTAFYSTVWCTLSGNITFKYYYPLELENKILQHFKTEDFPKIFDILDNVQKENSVNRILSGKALLHLFYDIKGTLLKLLDMTEIQPSNTLSQLFDQLDEQIPIDTFFQTAKTILQSLFEEKKKKSEVSLSTVILNYMDTVYSNPDFNRQMFARQFSISEDYVTNFFRSHTGFSFTEYLSKIRIKAACDLLTEGNYNIEKIARAVGYTNATSFRRAFKTITGVSPREYKGNQNK